jgi:hypothetical protein
MFSVLRLGERLHPELDTVFITQPDRSVPLPTSTEIAKCWEDVHTELLSSLVRTVPLRCAILDPGSGPESRDADHLHL